MWAGSLSHNDLTGLGAPKDFAPHQLGHELSARFDFAHGATLSAVWGSWAAYCWKTNPARFAQYGVKVWGLDPAGKTQEKLAQEAIARTVDFFRSLGMPTSLVELGCGLQTEEELEELAEEAAPAAPSAEAPAQAPAGAEPAEPAAAPAAEAAPAAKPAEEAAAAPAAEAAGEEAGKKTAAV